MKAPDKQEHIREVFWMETCVVLCLVGVSVLFRWDQHDLRWMTCLSCLQEEIQSPGYLTKLCVLLLFAFLVEYVHHRVSNDFDSQGKRCTKEQIKQHPLTQGHEGAFPPRSSLRSPYPGQVVSHIAILFVFYSHAVALKSAHQPWQELYDHVFFFSIFSLQTDLLVSLSKRYFLGAPLIALIMFLGLNFYLEAWMYFDLLNLFGLLAYHSLKFIFPKSFTVGEGWMVTASIVFLVRDDKMNLGVEIYLLKGLIVGTLFVCFLHRFLFQTPATNYKAVGLRLFFFVVGVLTIVLPWLTERFPIHPLRWLILFTTFRPHLWILLYWIIVLVCCLVVVDVRTLSKYEKTHARKYFHLVALALFVPVTFGDPNFMYNSYSIVMCLFLVSEWLRLAQLHGISQFIHSFISQFFDEKDAGVLKTSHISLLLACAIPLWLTMEPSHPLCNFAGLIIVGVGDAAASLIGKQYGRHKVLPHGQKSWEGCIASFCFSTLSLLVLSLWVAPAPWSLLQSICILLGTFLCCLLEAITEQNDNIIVPVFYFSVLNLFLTQ